MFRADRQATHAQGRLKREGAEEMANILVLGGGFGGVVAAERLAETLSSKHQITLVSRSPQFTFYPGLVRLAFGKAEVDDISYNLREAMLDRRVRFIEGEVERINPLARKALVTGGELKGELSYDYLLVALGRRLAIERVTGFREHAHHLLTVDAALRFGEAVRGFREGRAIIGYCKEARLAVPVYEAAFALARHLEEMGLRDSTRITLVSPERPDYHLGGAEMAAALHGALDAHDVEFLPNFPITEVTPEQVRTANGLRISYDLLLLVPPFQGTLPVAEMDMDLTTPEGYLSVDRMMRVPGVQGLYAVGDCVNFNGPKMGHMAVHQAEVAAANIISEIQGQAPAAIYDHEMMLVIDEGGPDSIYLHKGMWTNGEATVRRGRFWGWAKRVQERYWQSQHS
jgi:sulfide:quinone oxidoreductase